MSSSPGAATAGAACWIGDVTLNTIKIAAISPRVRFTISSAPCILASPESGTTSYGPGCADYKRGTDVCLDGFVMSRGDLAKIGGLLSARSAALI